MGDVKFKLGNIEAHMVGDGTIILKTGESRVRLSASPAGGGKASDVFDDLEDVRDELAEIRDLIRGRGEHVLERVEDRLTALLGDALPEGPGAGVRALRKGAGPAFAQEFRRMSDGKWVSETDVVKDDAQLLSLYSVMEVL